MVGNYAMSLHKSEGYSIILASPFEVGLMRHGTIVKTWKLGAFNDRMPELPTRQSLTF